MHGSLKRDIRNTYVDAHFKMVMDYCDLSVEVYKTTGQQHWSFNYTTGSKIKYLDHLCICKCSIYLKSAIKSMHAISNLNKFCFLFLALTCDLRAFIFGHTLS